MGITTRIDPIDRNIALAIREGENPQERGRRLASYARGALKDAQEQNRQALGYVPDHETFVDGRKGAPLESVRPDGVIVFEFDLIEDMFAWIGAMLVQHSPVRSGRYSDSHVFLADGEEVEPGIAAPEADEYVFVNVQPYARKIERGLSPQAPDGVYEAVAAMAARRFGNVAKIRFSYRSPLFGGVHEWAGKTNMKSPYRKGAKRDAWLTRQPAIVITR